MSVVNKIIVTCRLENGDSIDVSAKVENRNFSADDASKLLAGIEKKIVPHVEDTLYYQVRTWSGNAGQKRLNWKRLPTLDSLHKVIEEVMVTSGEKAST